MTPLRGRPTSDLIVLFLAAIIGFAVVAGVVGVVVLKVLNPDGDIDSSVKVIGDILTTILGAVIGFVGGRAQGSNEGYEKAKAERAEPVPPAIR